ncbi:MAG: hypothetical protein EAZ90_25055 [Oscillatoriales cyanobacterium]|jgi:hypothetical protein|nr:MAG: hypothetical protein EAZ94_21645 [Oscillatoriales cyanobacterium]TAE28372.1 MAG: hypothetical protein EAZ93_02925 [Oscillatoriales cyanobacterium]TAE38452.1 MAG: hypothetical protein EAZ90_25055 [Oscillatoriales cyanobacterium]TAF94307.1 MAG: hypothetical protein EAZ45_27730 [Oscillatoriales cyanobacterium]TAG15532.1 MAG: hypothetical protein EAZ39_20430 [Oscillatoriales cyanobacterium]
MKRKLNWLWHGSPTRLQNRSKMCKPSLARGVADARFTCAHWKSAPKKPQMLARQTTDTPALYLCVERVTATISKSDIIGAAITK